MKKVHIVSRPTSVDDVSNYYDDLEDTMGQQKVERARIRRYRELKRQIA